MGRGLQCSRRHLPTRERGSFGVGIWLIEVGRWALLSEGIWVFVQPRAR